MVYNIQINGLHRLKLCFVHSKWLVLTFRFLFHFLLFFSRLMISWFIVTTQHLSFTTNKNLQKSNNNDDSVQIPVQFFVRLLKIIEDFCLHAMGCWAVTPSTYITCVYWMFTKSMSNMSDSVPLDKMVLLFVRANNQGYQSSINFGLHTLAYFSSHEGECSKW